MRIHLSSLGCKLNQSEMDALANRFALGGHEIVPTAAEADLCILNTCAVTHVAAQKSRQALRRLHRQNSDARLVATGCYAELTPADLRDLPGVELVVGNREKEHLWRILGDGSEPAPQPSPMRRRRTRALVKIQDGCDNTCTYCIIHVARGPQRSRPPDQVVAEVQARLDAGYQEIVLTGVHIGAYGRDRQPGPGEADLWALVSRILSETPVPRLRLSSIEPWDLSEGAFRLWTDPRLCRHLHLPLQSGSDATLRRMARHYTSAEFAALVAAARQAIPNLAVTTDVIVGFPGEDDEEFAQSLDFVRRLAFARVHVFPYSLRPGTPAAKMAGQVPPTVKAERSKAMRAVAAASEQAFRRQFVGRILNALWESHRAVEGVSIWRGLTDNYIRVQTEAAEDLRNTITPTQLLGLVQGGMQGRIIM